MNRLLIAFIFAAVLAEPAVFANVAGAPIMADQRPVADLVQEIGIDQKLDAQLPLDLIFKNEKGETVKLGDYFGSKPVLLNLVYFRCPMLCSFVMDGVVKALKPLKFTPGNEFQIITVSIDPKDTPEAASAKKEKIVGDYKRPGVEKGWHFLTGEKESIEKLANAVGFRYVYDSKSEQYAHAGGLMIATPEGRLSRYFYGIEYAPRDLRFALIEASKNKIGSLSDQLLLLCFHYDPMTGKYGLVITSVLKIAGCLTAAVLILGVLFMLYSEKAGKV